MNKSPRIRAIIQNTNLTDEAKTAQIVDLLNNAVESVVDDLFNALSTKGLLNDVGRARNEKDLLLGQATRDDYPQI